MSPRSLQSVLCLVGVALLSFAAVATAAPGNQGHEGAARVAPVFPGCAWPVESTPALANEAGPDPNATYWTTPFKTGSSFRSVTIRGTYPTARFMSFVVYNNGGDDFTETFKGKSVESAIADYEIAPNRGSVNPWQVSSVRAGKATRYTMRTYIPSGGNTTVKLPKVIINRVVKRDGAKRITHTPLPTCNAVRIARAEKASKALKRILAKVNGEATPTTPVTPCTVNGVPRYSNGCAKPLEWIQSSSEQIGALFPNPSNAYISTYFYPSPGTVMVTRALMPVTPRTAGSGTLGDSIGATPVDWLTSPLPYQLRYWSVNNYLVKEPYPVVTEGVGPNRRYGGTADYQTAVDSSGYYTVVSSLPDDKPTEASLAASAATWIPMQGDQPAVAETQWMRNMMGEDFANAIQQIPHPQSPTEYVPSPVVAQAMGSYYPTSVQCPVGVFQTEGVSGCVAASSPAAGPSGS